MIKTSAGRLLILGGELAEAGGFDRRLCDLGYEVVAVLDNSDEACARARDSDLVLVDRNLGRDEGGEDVARLLRNQHDLPVLLVSRSDRDDALAGAGAAPGGVPCIRFPIEERELRAVLQNELIRHRVEIERRRLETRMLARQNAEVIGAIGRRVVHDFNNILQSMIGHTELAAMSPPGGSCARTTLGKVVDSGMAGAALCRQFVLCTESPAGSAEHVDFSTVVREIQFLLRSMVRKGTRIEHRLAADLPVVCIPAGELRQILFNLVLNSSDAIGIRRGELIVATGRLQLSPTDAAALFPPADVIVGDCVFLEVTDDGGGIQAEPAARIFEPGFTTKPAASGLGLCAVRDLARRHGGAVALTNRAGEGATFRVYFPVAKSPCVA